MNTLGLSSCICGVSRHLTKSQHLKNCVVTYLCRALVCFPEDFLSLR